MSAPAASEPSEPMRWFQPLIGLVFASLVLGSVAAATAYSDSNRDDSHAVHDDDGHGEAEADGHGETDEAEDDSHGESEDDGH